MSAGAQVDFDALAAKHGGTSAGPAAIDFDALAAKHGASIVSGTTTTPTATPPATSSQTSSPPQSWTDSLGDFASHVWNQINPIAGVKGAAQAAAHPVDTFKTDAAARQQVYDEAEQSFKNKDYAGGAAKLLYSALPLVGPQMNQAANDFAQGKTAAALGTSTGMGLALAGPEALKGASISPLSQAQPLAEKMYQSALKPSTTYSADEAANMVRTGLENKIPISETGTEKLGALVSDLNDKVKAQIQAGSNAGATVNKFSVASRLWNTAKKFSTQVTPQSDLNDISKVGNDFLDAHPDEIPALQAQNLKSGTYSQLNDKAYGELSSATTEAQKSLARGIKEELQQQFPEIQGLNAKEGQLIGLDDALQRAVRRTTNRNIFSLGGKIAAGAGGTVGAIGGGGVGAGAGVASASALHYFMTDPVVQSRLAISLYQASHGALSLGAAESRVGGYVNALGNASGNENQ